MEVRTLSDGAFHPNSPAVRFDDMPRDGKPKTGASRLAGPRGVHAVEALENALQISLGNSDPRIGNSEFDLSVT